MQALNGRQYFVFDCCVIDDISFLIYCCDQTGKHGRGKVKFVGVDIFTGWGGFGVVLLFHSAVPFFHIYNHCSTRTQSQQKNMKAWLRHHIMCNDHLSNRNIWS